MENLNPLNSLHLPQLEPLEQELRDACVNVVASISKSESARGDSSSPGACPVVKIKQKISYLIVVVLKGEKK